MTDKNTPDTELPRNGQPPSTDQSNSDVENESDSFLVPMFKTDFVDSPREKPAEKSPVVIVFSSTSIGRENTELGEMLTGDFLATLSEKALLPQWLFLINTGVRLGLKGSASLPLLQKLEGLGVKVLVSKTSLYHLGAETELRVGEAVTMFSFIEIMYKADKFISL